MVAPIRLAEDHDSRDAVDGFGGSVA